MRVGLALGGGVVRGYAHIGVLSVLEREGIPIHCIAGTSAGAIMGALYAGGFRASRVAELAVRVHWWQIARPTFPVHGLVSFAPLQRWLSRTLGDIRFEDLKIPFVAVATDLEAGEALTLRAGRLAPAVRASCSVPGIVAPLRLDGHLLCDGGVSDNVPVSAARALGADYVIGVSLFDPISEHPHNWLQYSFSAVETLVRRAGGGVDAADCLIRPDLVGSSYVRFSKRLEMMRKGEIATERQLDAIRQALRGEPVSQAATGHAVDGNGAAPGEPARTGEHLHPPLAENSRHP
jgi:NTE family protein